MKTTLAIRHIAFEDLGSLAGVLAQRQLAVTYRDAADGLSDIDPLAADLMVVLGGPIGVYEAESYPFIADEIRLLERRLAAGRPTLGICLGAQMMARALGARVFPGPAKEIGWGPLTLTPEGERSCLRPLAGDGAAVLHWHGDTFDLPAGAVRLASTELYVNQAFAYESSALGLQFHPEVTAAGLERWFVGHACEIGHVPGVSVTRLRDETRRAAGILARRAPDCFAAWLDGVGL